MDKALIERWNKKVTNKDIVYVLGDISWHDDEKTYELVSQLRGRKNLVQGNHDKIREKVGSLFGEICFYKEIVLPGKTRVVLCHYPIVFFNHHRHGGYMLYGHVHNTSEWTMTEHQKHELQQLNIKCNMFNVGCMLHNYEPVSLDEIIKMEERKNQYASD